MSQIDFKGVCSEVRVNCIKCNPQEKVESGIRGKGKGDKENGSLCKEIGKDCPFVITSNRGKNNGKCIGLSSKIFKKYGLKTLKRNSTYKYGKSHFFFFLYHPELNWEFPEMPDFDRFGDKVDKEKNVFTLGHLDGDHFNDSKDNLFILLKTEHGVLEPNTKRTKEPKTLREAGCKDAI